MRALAVALTVVAAGCMAVAIKGMVTGRPGARAGYALRIAAVVSFGAAVAIGASVH